MAGSIRFDGLVSGIDWSELVDKMTDLERAQRILPLQRQEAQLMAKQAAWRDVRSGLAALESKLMDLKLEGTYTGLKATSANEDVAMASVKAGAQPAMYTIKVERLATATQVWSKKLGADEPLEVGKGQLTINEVEIGHSKDVNLSVLAAQINFAMGEADDAEAGRKVTASVVDGRLVLKSALTGEDGKIELGWEGEGEGEGNSLLAKLGLETIEEGYPGADPDNDAGAIVRGKNAIFYLDGVRIERGQNRVDDAVFGMTLELTGTSKNIGGGGWEGFEGTKLSVAQDVDKAVNAIKAFVDEYNRVWKANREKQHWDKDNEQGAILFGDSALNGIQYRLRSLVMDPVGGTAAKWNMLAQIGISTGKVGTGASADGTLHLDEAKLRQAVQEDPAGVQALFNGEGGVAAKLDRYLKDVLTKDKMGMLTAKDEALSNQIKNLQKQTERMEERILRREENMRRQYVQLEKVLGQLQAQGNWLGQQLAAFTGGQWN